MPVAVGQRLGPYEVQALIGAGGMGEVYRAIDTRLNRIVALKVLPQNLASDPDRRARFGAVYALLGGISAPITFFAIRLFRTIHPVVIGGTNAEAQGGFNLSADMRVAFFFALFAFTVFFIDLFWNRVRLGDLQNKVEQLKLKVTM